MTILMLDKMSENTKRILILLCLFLILFFVFMGALATAVQSAMKKQGAKADEMLADVTNTNYFEKESKYRKFAIKKNIRVFYSKAKIPFLIMLGCIAAYLLYCLFGNKWGYNPFNGKDGFGSLLIKFGKAPREKFFGITLISDWAPIIKPEPVAAGIFSYIFVPIFLAGCVWFLICTQGYISRSIRIRQIVKGIYRKKLVPDEKPTLTETNN